MSETEPVNPEAAPLTERPKRSATFLGRIARALRRQDWVTVAVEVSIVVLGVVIGFQVTAWGQERSDRARERGHLHQLAADLRETVRLVHAADSSRYESERAAGLLWDAFYAPEPPPRDSLLAWRAHASFSGSTYPVLGTAEALVSSGEIALMRDDTLRTAILAYLQDARREVDTQKLARARWWDGVGRLERRFTVTEAFAHTFTSGEREAFFGEGPNFPVRELGSMRWRFPVDAEAFLSDVEMENAAQDVTGANYNSRTSRARMRDSAARLLHRVEFYLGHDGR